MRWAEGQAPASGALSWGSHGIPQQYCPPARAVRGSVPRVFLRGQSLESPNPRVPGGKQVFYAKHTVCTGAPFNISGSGGPSPNPCSQTPAQGPFRGPLSQPCLVHALLHLAFLVTGPRGGERGILPEPRSRLWGTMGRCPRGGRLSPASPAPLGLTPGRLCWSSCSPAAGAPRRTVGKHSWQVFRLESALSWGPRAGVQQRAASRHRCGPLQSLPTLSVPGAVLTLR